MTKAITQLRVLMFISCVLTGFLAGENLDRYLIQVPAWHQVNIISWAEYVRHADLSINGMLLYPAEAIISTLLLVTASVIVLRNRNEFLHISAPINTSTCFALAGLGLTIFAAPYLLKIESMPDDPELLQKQFDSFHFWGLWRAIAQVLSFCTCVWALGRFADEKIKS